MAVVFGTSNLCSHYNLYVTHQVRFIEVKTSCELQKSVSFDIGRGGKTKIYMKSILHAIFLVEFNC